MRQFILNCATSLLSSYFQEAAETLPGELLGMFQTHEASCAAFAAAAHAPATALALRQLQEHGVVSEHWSIDGELSSLRRTVFVNSFTARVVQAERGTDYTDACDLVTDFSIAAGEEKYSSRRYESASVLQRVIERYGKDNVTVTGHALGGGFAQLLAAQSGIFACGYNPAIVGQALLQNVATYQDFVTVTSGSTEVHGVRQFLQDSSNKEEFFSRARKVIAVAAESAKFSESLTGMLISSLVPRDTQPSKARDAALIATTEGFVAGGVGGATALALGSVPVTTTAPVVTTVTAPGVWGWLGYTSTVVEQVTTTSSLASSVGYTKLGLACMASVPVAAVTAAVVVYNQLGCVTLSEALSVWRDCQPDKRITDDRLFFEGSVRDDLRLPREFEDNGWWKGFVMGKGVIAMRTESNAFTSQFAGAYNMVRHGQEKDGKLLGFIWVNNCKIKVRRVQ